MQLPNMMPTPTPCPCRLAASLFLGVVSSDKAPLPVALSADIPTYIAQTIGFVSMTMGAKATARLNRGPPICVIGLDQSATVKVALDQNARMVGKRMFGIQRFDQSEWSQHKGQGFAAIELYMHFRRNRWEMPRVSRRLTAPSCPIHGLAARRPLPTAATLSKRNMTINSVISSLPRRLMRRVACDQWRNGAAPGRQLRDERQPARVDNGATWEGAIPAFIFTGAGSDLEFDTTSRIDLRAPKTGPLA